MSLSKDYLNQITQHLNCIHDSEYHNILEAAKLIASQIAQDKVIHVAASGGHSNLATQEIFFRAGGLMHINPIIDEGTLLTNGALRSMAIERLADYGKIVVQNNPMECGDVLLLINAYGINAAILDIALEAKKKGVTVIAITSIEHAQQTSAEHPARHPSKQNLCEVVDLVLDCKVQVGDAIVQIEGITQKVAAISTFANSFILNALVIETVNLLAQQGIEPPIWKSGNVIGGDEWNQQFIARFKDRIRLL